MTAPRGLVAALALAVACLAPGAARAGDGGTPASAPRVHVSVARVKVTGPAAAAVPRGAVAEAVCKGLSATPGISCLTADDANGLGQLRALQGMTGVCAGGGCANTDAALASPDDVVEVSVAAKAGAFVLDVAVMHPPRVAPLFHAKVRVGAASDLASRARTEAAKAAPVVLGAH